MGRQNVKCLNIKRGDISHLTLPSIRMRMSSFKLRDSDDTFNISGNFYDEDYDDEYDYDDNYIEGVYGNKKEFSSSDNKKVNFDGNW